MSRVMSGWTLRFESWAARCMCGRWVECKHYQSCQHRYLMFEASARWICLIFNADQILLNSRKKKIRLLSFAFFHRLPHFPNWFLGRNFRFRRVGGCMQIHSYTSRMVGLKTVFFLNFSSCAFISSIINGFFAPVRNFHWKVEKKKLTIKRLLRS